MTGHTSGEGSNTYHSVDGRGGRVTHALARAGWAVFGVVGALVMVVVTMFYTASPGENALDNAPAANFIGGLVVFVPIGAVLGGLLGLGAQVATRSWLQAPSRAESRAVREADTRQARLATHGLRPSSRWARSYLTCARSVAAFHSVVESMPEGAARDWAADIGSTLDDELAEALRLATLGESLAPDGAATLTDTALGGTALRVAELLREAETAFAETTDRLATVVLDLRDDSDFVRVRAQLDMLAGQAPHLREEGLD